MRLSLLLALALLTGCCAPRDGVVIPAPIPVDVQPEPNPVFVKPMTPKP